MYQSKLSNTKSCQNFTMVGLYHHAHTFINAAIILCNGCLEYKIGISPSIRQPNDLISQCFAALHNIRMNILEQHDAWLIHTCRYSRSTPLTCSAVRYPSLKPWSLYWRSTWNPQSDVIRRSIVAVCWSFREAFQWSNLVKASAYKKTAACISATRTDSKSKSSWLVPLSRANRILFS